MVRLQFLGAAGCVTGSCMLLTTSNASVLVECGMFQGSKTLKALNYEPFPFDVRAIDAVLLTHAHIDHSGLLPKLALAGFRKRIFATQGTIDLCGVLLPDSGAIQEMEVETLNRRNARHGKNTVAPIFTKADAEESLKNFTAVPFEAWVEIATGVRARWWNAGHILGAASIEVEVEDAGEKQTLLFSGDLGPGGRRFADDPTGPSGVDHLVVESTYGDIERPPLGEAERKRMLAAEVMEAHAAGGPLLIPAFAVERTQELISDLLELMDTDQAPPAPIFLDSPLAIRACDIFLRHDDANGSDTPFERLRESQWLRFTERVDESRAIERMRGWHIIIAASGMCDAGRVRHHLKRLLWRPEATVMLAGYQAIGTLGRLLQEGNTAVRIQGDDIDVKARIRNIDIYSGHADANGLVGWVQARAPVRGSIFLTHGEPENLAALQKRLAAVLPDTAPIVAELDRVYRLAPAARANPEPHARARLTPRAVGSLDWHNARSALLLALNARLEAAPDDAAREAIIATLVRQLQ